MEEVIGMNSLTLLTCWIIILNFLIFLKIHRLHTDIFDYFLQVLQLVYQILFMVSAIGNFIQSIKLCNLMAFYNIIKINVIKLLQIKIFHDLVTFLFRQITVTGNYVIEF